MDISSFDDLLQAARQQPEPQRLLFVFTAVDLPDDATAAQHARFEAGQGCAPVPLMCVDKTPQELPSFAALVEDARQFTAPGHDWAMVFAAAMPGTLNRRPPLQRPRPRCSAWSMRSSKVRSVPTSRLTARASQCGLAEVVAA